MSIPDFGFGSLYINGVLIMVIIKFIELTLLEVYYDNNNSYRL